MSALTPERLAELADLARAATPEWAVDSERPWIVVGTSCSDPTTPGCEPEVKFLLGHLDDAAFVGAFNAATCTALLGLLDALTARAETYRAAMSAIAIKTGNCVEQEFAFCDCVKEVNTLAREALDLATPAASTEGEGSDGP